MNHKSIKFLSLVLFAMVLVFSSCEDDPKLPDNVLEFESSVAGIASEEESLSLNINLSRAASTDVGLTLSVNGGTLVYGTDYTTTPEATAQVITLTIPKGETSTHVVINKVAGVGFGGDETIVAELVSIDGSPVMGENSKITITFSEITVMSGNMTVQGGGTNYPNRVFIDLSANRQTAVARTAWDIGFYSGDDFRVILNSATGMMAYALDKNDLTTVTNADTAVLRNRLSLEAVFAAITSETPPDWVSSAVNWIDDPSGDLTKTALSAISATAAENKVYIINRGSGPGSPAPALGWKKIRVIRNGSGYTLQHADINATTFSEVQITKNTDYEFQYVSFANGAVTVEPARGRWDIAWTGFTNATNLGSGHVPYYFQDIVLQNRENVQTVQVLTSTKSYETFGAADIIGLNFGTQSQAKIGSNWRSGGGPGTSPAVRTDRFYVIKDAEGNFYKLKFTSLTTDGERGRPSFEYIMLQEAE